MTGPKLQRKLDEMNVDSPGELQCHIKAVQATVEDLKRKITMKEAFNSGVLSQEWLQAKASIFFLHFVIEMAARILFIMQDLQIPFRSLLHKPSAWLNDRP